MKRLGQILRESQSPTGGNHASSHGELRRGGAKASSARRHSPRLNLGHGLRVGSWNVLSLSSDDHLPLVARELGRLDIALAALSEVRRPHSGLTSVEGYTFHWSGRSDGQHLAGVAFAVADWLAPFLLDVTPVSERILTLRLKHSLGVMFCVSLYAPTESGQLSVKNAFYSQLSSVIARRPKSDSLLVMGDFNACTGTDRISYESCVGPHGSGMRNQNSALFLDFARSHGLRIAGSWFQRPDLHRWSWYSNTGRVAKEIDHILVDTRWRLLQNCRVFRSAEFLNTDHRLVVASLRVQLKSRRQPSKNKSRFDVDCLRDDSVSQRFRSRVLERFENTDTEEDTETLWGGFKQGILDAASECLIASPRTKRRSFLSDDALALIEMSRKAKLEGKTGLCRKLRRDTVRAVRVDKERFVRGICEQVEHHLWSSDARPAYRGIQALRSVQPHPRCMSVRADTGEILFEEEQVRARWAGYFEQLYKADPPAYQVEISEDPRVSDAPSVDTGLPSLGETRKAVARLKNRRAAGICGISPEFLKCGGEAVLKRLHAVICSAWDTGVIPSDWKRGLVVPLWKGKGDTLDCNNYRGVTLLSVPGKVFARIIRDRILPCLMAGQRPQQSGFTAKKSTIDRILALRVLIEQKGEFRQRLHAAYVDLRKAFDSVHRASLWRLLRSRGIPSKIVNLIAELYSDTSGAVRCGGGISDFFPVNCGVRQGCVLAPNLFNTCMDWILGKVSGLDSCGVSLGGVRFTDLDFADDAVVFAESLDSLVTTLEALSRESAALGLQVSWTKTRIQSFGDSCGESSQALAVGSQSVDFTDQFTYLGGVVHGSGRSEADVNRRLGLATGAMASLTKGVWRCRYLCRRTKVQVFRVLVLPVLLYGCETWTLTGSLRRRLNSFGTVSLRRILGCRWSDFVSNDQLLRESGMRYITCIIRERRLRLFGHVARFKESDPAHQILFLRNLVDQGRRRGRPQASWLRQMDSDCREMSTGLESARRLAQRRPLEYRQKVDAATRCLGACSHT